MLKADMQDMSEVNAQCHTWSKWARQATDLESDSVLLYGKGYRRGHSGVVREDMAGCGHWGLPHALHIQHLLQCCIALRITTCAQATMQNEEQKQCRT